MLKPKSITACLSLFVATLPAIVTASADTGGFFETPETALTRPPLSNSVIQNLLPERGYFTFPAPYNTPAVRLTNGSDCAGNDCVNYAGYSYWRNMNNHVGMDSMFIFLGLDQSRGGNGPSLFELNKLTGEVETLGALFPSDSHLSWATGEGWYFSATMPTKLYINDGPRIVRFDVISEQMQTVVDVTEELGKGYYLTQMHSSDDDRVHSATVRDAKSYNVLGCMAYEEDSERYHYYPFERDFDECQVDRSGEWLLIKANLDGQYGEDNLIINLQTGVERVLLDQDGAAGHSDLGHGYMIAADNWADDANTWKLWDFNQSVLQGEQMYHNSDWTVSAPDHVSHTNARPGVPAREQHACASSVNRNAGPHANEIICFNLDGSGTSLVVAPVMTDLNASGGGDNYAKAPKGNLDVTGRYFLWTSNAGGSRLDAFIVRVPEQLPGTQNDSQITVGETSESDTAADGLLQWHDIRNVTINGDSVAKTSGCNGCPDAGAVSVQSVPDGKASFAFTADATGPLLFAGLTRQQSITTGQDLEFSVRLQQGIAEVRESGVYKADVRFVAGDHFTIVMDHGQVKYMRNGTVFHRSATTARYPLYAGLAFSNTGAMVRDARFILPENSQVIAASGPDTALPSLSLDKIPGGSIVWQDAKNVTMAGRSLTKTSGCDGCTDASAVSVQNVTHGAASFAFTADTTGPVLFAGLTGQQSIATGQDLEFSVRLQQGIAEVRERGIYRADIRFTAGDRFEIFVDNGKVKYMHNGNVFHTSKAALEYPLFVGTVLKSMGANLKDTRFIVGEMP